MKKVFMFAAKISVLGAFATAQLVSAPVWHIQKQIEVDNPYHPDYVAFSTLVREYKWHKGLQLFGVDDPVQLVTLEFQAMTHPGRPKNFTLSDLGAIGCLPSHKTPGFPEFTGCHAATLREEKDNMPTPTPKKA
ncbi:MAG: hypothetical protein MRY79_07975 [Alphaproteobacteria bacterium]|nr:hypothetical protein [Alphaproteobacteria bacterium]